MISQNVDYQGNGVREMFIKQNSDIKGNDFIYNEWNSGILVFNDSVFSKQAYLKYDVYRGQVLIRNTKKPDEIIEISDRTLTGFAILERNRNLKHNFVKLKSFNFEGEAEDGFYEIVINHWNVNYFIKKNSKVVYDPNRSEGSQTANNLPFEFKDKTEYYILNSDGLYVNVRLKKKDIKSVLNKNTKLVDTYIKTNKIKFHKENDVMKLVNYYYSL
tara:strand:- start:16255 stop:16902 length:648 start_codon:yes stop_codon:yes gene_type:complete